MLQAAAIDPLRRTLLIAWLGACAGCSADAVSEPVPTLQTVGAYVAVGPVNGTYVLFRILLVLSLENQTVLFVFRYAPLPKSIAEARALARDGNLQASTVETQTRDALEAAGAEVVWFRTLTEEERDAIP
jgi:hypothetical protein